MWLLSYAGASKSNCLGQTPACAYDFSKGCWEGAFAATTSTGKGKGVLWTAGGPWHCAKTRHKLWNSTAEHNRNLPRWLIREGYSKWGPSKSFRLTFLADMSLESPNNLVGCKREEMTLTLTTLTLSQHVRSVLSTGIVQLNKLNLPHQISSFSVSRRAQ